MTDRDADRHDRTRRAIGSDALEQLQDTHVVQIGAGGVGSHTGEQLAQLGVGELTVVDPDTIEESNLPRLAYTGNPDHVGLPKVGVMRDDLATNAPDTVVHPVMQEAESVGHLLNRADIIVAGVDKVSTRMWLNEFAVRHDMPYIDAGVTITTGDDNAVEVMEGYIQRIVPDETACFDCLHRGDPEQARIEQLSDTERTAELEQGYIDADILTPNPAIVPPNTVVTGLTLQVITAQITDTVPPADHLRLDATQYTLEADMLAPRDDCPTCGYNL